MLNDLQLLEDKVINLVEELEKTRGQMTTLREENEVLRNAQEKEQEKLSGILSLIEASA